MFLPYAVLAALLVAVDQIVKQLVLQHVEPYAHVPFIPGLVEITHVENTGAAFSLFAGQTWILTLISLLLSIVLAVAIWKNFFHHPFGKISLTLLLAGAVGNLIDRAFRGYVVDMFNVLFMNFAVFNVADICVVTGSIAAGFYYLFLYSKLEPQGKDRGDSGEEEGSGDAEAETAPELGAPAAETGTDPEPAAGDDPGAYAAAEEEESAAEEEKGAEGP